MVESTCDVAVVGGGIVGLATALALARRGDVRVTVLEAEDRLAAHQTGHNSGVIHSGLYYRPGSLKARLCVEGREALYGFCREHGVPHERCGKLVVATREEEIPALRALAGRGAANGLAGLEWLDPEGVRAREPHVRAVAGLHVPDTGITDYVQVAGAYARAIAAAGGRIRTATRVLRAAARGDVVEVATASGALRARVLVNCAGLHSDRVARSCGADPGLRIVPFRGEYHELLPGRRHLVRHLVYPVPDPRYPFLGVHFTRMIGGGVEAGPNAVLALARHGYGRFDLSPRDVAGMAAYPGFWRMARRHWRTGIAESWRSLSTGAFVAALRRMVPGIRREDVRRAGAGVRAQAVDPSGALVDDFRIVHAGRMVHVLNAPSPAATASLAIGAEVAGHALRAMGDR